MNHYYKMNKKEERFIQLIRTVELDKPSVNFTENLLDYLRLEEKAFVDETLIFNQELNKTLIPSVSDDFMNRTIIALEEKTRTTSSFKPLFSKKTKIIIFSVFVISCLLSIYEDGLEILYFSEKTISQIEWFHKLFNVPLVLSISVFAFLLLLFLDLFLRKEQRLY